MFLGRLIWVRVTRPNLPEVMLVSGFPKIGVLVKLKACAQLEMHALFDRKSARETEIQLWRRVPRISGKRNPVVRNWNGGVTVQIPSAFDAVRTLVLNHASKDGFASFGSPKIWPLGMGTGAPGCAVKLQLVSQPPAARPRNPSCSQRFPRPNRNS